MMPPSQNRRRTDCWSGPTPRFLTTATPRPGLSLIFGSRILQSSLRTAFLFAAPLGLIGAAPVRAQSEAWQPAAGPLLTRWADRGVGGVIDEHRYPGPGDVPETEDNRAAVLGEFGGQALVVKEHLWLQDLSRAPDHYKTSTRPPSRRPNPMRRTTE